MEPIYLLICTIIVWVLLFGDYRQTLKIKLHPNLHEINPLLGLHPSDTKIAIYFILCAFISAIAPWYMTILWHQISWFVFWAGMEIWALQNNLKFGLSFK